MLGVISQSRQPGGAAGHLFLSCLHGSKLERLSLNAKQILSYGFFYHQNPFFRPFHKHLILNKVSKPIKKGVLQGNSSHLELNNQIYCKK